MNYLNAFNILIGSFIQQEQNRQQAHKLKSKKLNQIIIKQPQYYPLKTEQAKQNSSMIKNNKPDLYQINQQSSAHHAMKLTAKKIDCDQLLNNYLQYSLGASVNDEMNKTKQWIKNNRKEAKNIINKAHRDLRKVVDGKVAQSHQLMSPQNKSITHLLVNQTTKFSPPKMFNLRQMQKITSLKQQQRNLDKKKMKHLKKVNQYLTIISRLERVSDNNKKNASIIHSPLNRSRMQSTKLQLMNTCPSVCRDITNKQNKYLSQKVQNSTLNNSAFESKNSLHENINNLNASTSGVGSPKIFKCGFHPFLQRNLGMLYEPKKKKMSKTLSKKFNLSRAKKQTYY